MPRSIVGTAGAAVAVAVAVASGATVARRRGLGRGRRRDGRLGLEFRRPRLALLAPLRRARHLLRAGADRLADPRIRAAAADVADLLDVAIGDRAATLLAADLVDERDRPHDLPGLAIAALRDVEVEPCLLHRVQFAVLLADGLGQALDRRDLVRRLDLGDRHGAGVERLAVDVAGARLADVDAAPVLGPGDAEHVAEDPQRPDVPGDVDFDLLAVEDEAALGHFPVSS